MNSVDIAVDGVVPQVRLTNLSRFCERVLAAVGIDDWELSLLLCDDERMRALNARYRGVNKATDVLSFPLLEGIAAQACVTTPQQLQIAGDIVISVETATRNARAAHRPAEEELRHLIVHGILHLHGHDHPDYSQDSADRDGHAALPAMIALQEDIVRRVK